MVATYSYGEYYVSSASSRAGSEDEGGNRRQSARTSRKLPGKTSTDINGRRRRDKGKRRESASDLSPSSSASSDADSIADSSGIDRPDDDRTGNSRARANGMDSSSSSSSSDYGGSSSSSYSSETDSEEDEFPVESVQQRSSTALADRRRRRRRRRDAPDEGGAAQRAARRHLRDSIAYEDPLDAYFEREQLKARRRAQIAHNRDLAALRTIRLNAFARADEAARARADADLEIVTLVLQDISLRRQQDEEKIDREFKERNAQRWNEINSAIAHLEKLQSAAEEARKKQIQAENEARRLREEEEKKIQSEKEEKQQREQQQREKEKAEEDRKQREQEEKERRETSLKAAEARQAKPSTTSPAATSAGGVGGLGNPLEEGRRDFERWHAKIKDIKENVLPAVSANPAWRNACRSLKRNLSTRISNVSASASDVAHKTQEIHRLLNESKGAGRETYIWSLNLFSKRIIGMANMNTEADQSGVTYALAQVVVSLLCSTSDHTTDLAEILMARLVKRCPYVLPYYPARGQLSIEAFNKLIGRKASEATINYNQRMSGIVAFYAAILQTSPASVPQLSQQGQQSNVPSYFRPEAGWRWLATIVRPPLPLLDVTPLLMYTFLRMTGERFHSLYGKQFIKLVLAIAEQGIDQSKVKWNKDVQGDLSKVRLLIGDWMQTGRITGAEGRVPIRGS